MSKPEKQINAAVIVAAGRGERIAASGDGQGPKQYRTIGEKSVLAVTLENFCQHELIDHVQVVIHADDEALYAGIGFTHSKLLPPVIGGATRQESCANGVIALEAIAPERVLIHDAARPFTSHDTITKTLAATSKGACALPVSIISATIKKVENDLVVDTVDRTGLYTAQTPQGLAFDDATAIHKKARAEGLSHFTDDAALAEWAGIKVQAVEVADDNPKITTMEDLKMAERRTLQGEHSNALPDVRTGTGYDTHRLVPGDEIVLGGVTIPFDKKLDGHSDADVALHAITDAILGTIGAGDIGSHFPPSDAKWKGANSDQFLKHACNLVREKEGLITHLDVTLICEAPKIGPHRDRMRERIADICQIDASRVSVKATTNERIGFIGRGEGIAAIANATAVFQPILSRRANNDH